MKRDPTMPGVAEKAILRAVMLAVCIATCGAVFFPGPAGTAFALRIDYGGGSLDPAMKEKVSAALLKLKDSPADIAAIEVLLSIEPRVAQAAGTSWFFFSPDPLRKEALQWCLSLQPAEALVACLDKGSDTAVHWALRQVVWRRINDGFDDISLVRLMPGIEKALEKSAPATRAQAVRTRMIFLPSEQRVPFLKGLLKDQPDAVIAVAIEDLSSMSEVSPEIDAIVSRWLKTSEDPVLLIACCRYWGLAKTQQQFQPAVKAEEIAPFERLAGHADEAVRTAVTRALSTKVMANQPSAVAILLRLTFDKDPMVQSDAVSALRHANTPEVNARLHELFAMDQPLNLRAEALKVLGEFGKENLPLLVKAAKTDPEPRVRQNAVYALRIIGTPEARAALEVAAKDTDANVRKEARDYLEWYRKEHSKKKR